MSPELAMRTTDPDTQPLPRRDPGTTLVAELAAAEKWPTPEGYCYRCGFAPCSRKDDDCDPEPWTLASWANITAAGVEAATAGLPAGLLRWGPAHTRMVRALAAALTGDADTADRWRRDPS